MACSLDPTRLCFPSCSTSSSPSPSSLSWKQQHHHPLQLSRSFKLRWRASLSSLSSTCPSAVAAKQEPQSKRAQQRRSPSKRDENVVVLEPRKENVDWRKKKPGDNSSRSQKDGHSSANPPGPSPPLPLPSPPAGFILDERGGVALMAPPSKRVATIVDHATGRSLECLIRRVFSSSDGRQCFLMCPLDTPLQILRIEGDDEVLTDLTDEELEEILPAAAYELAKRRLHLVLSGYCLTARGGFCYTEEEIMDLNTVYGEGVGGSLHEGVEIASFRVKDTDFLVYTPFDPLMFVALKDEETGELRIAEDELLDDHAVLDAIDEEKEFQVLVEEEIAVNEALREVEE